MIGRQTDRQASGQTDKIMEGEEFHYQKPRKSNSVQIQRPENQQRQSCKSQFKSHRKRDEMSAQAVRQKAKRVNSSCLYFCSIHAISRLDDAHSHCQKQYNLLNPQIQMLIS